MEGYLQPDPTKSTRYAAMNPVTYVAVTDPTPVPRRTVVDRAKCNSCHADLAAHGGIRKSPEYCVMCHGPNKVGDQRVSRFEVASTVAPSVNFKVLVHKIHRGDQLTQGYVVGGYPPPSAASPAGTPVDFGTVGYPGDLRACWACHASTSYALPLPDGLLPTKTQQVLSCADPTLDPGTYCTTRVVASESFLAPASAACTACHDEPSSVAHARVMTASDGTESCATCHGFGAQWDVQAVHVLPP
jgi:OmcA/MtrC family decaheme c-type cytochrome